MQDHPVTYRLQQFHSGLVDELVIDPTTLTLLRTGAARYELTHMLPEGRVLSVRLWTTGKGSIATQIDPDLYQAPSDRLSYKLSPEGTLLSLEAQDVGVHLEHMDRGHYWLELSPHGHEPLAINFHTPGYLNAMAEDRLPA